VSFESKNGVLLDNYAFRGSDGHTLNRIPPAVLQSFQQHCNYQLIILHYGVNVIGSNNTDFAWYERAMNKTLLYLRANFPDTPILLIGTSDKATRSNGVWQTDAGVPVMTALQQQLAQQHKLGFWNLYESMGGYNAMVKWVSGDTVFAYKDYTHINPKGARKVATLLYTALMEDYRQYVSSAPAGDPDRDD
jgi:lysophospholipase L1-like esterase